MCRAHRVGKQNAQMNATEFNQSAQREQNEQQNGIAHSISNKHYKCDSKATEKNTHREQTAVQMQFNPKRKFKITAVQIVV